MKKEYSLSMTFNDKLMIEYLNVYYEDQVQIKLSNTQAVSMFDYYPIQKEQKIIIIIKNKKNNKNFFVL